MDVNESSKPMLCLILMFDDSHNGEPGHENEEQNDKERYTVTENITPALLYSDFV